MKNRVTLTMDPEIAKKAKRIAHARRTSVSALIEDLLRATPVSRKKSEPYTIEKWIGKFQVRKSVKDTRLDHLKKRYGLE